MSVVTPALTVEEWRWSKDAAVTLIVEHPNSHETMGRHAAAALCLHDQPFGFTREDVALVRGAASLLPEILKITRHLPTEAMAMLPQAVRDTDTLTSLADRIEALLSPEDACPGTTA